MIKNHDPQIGSYKISIFKDFLIMLRVAGAFVDQDSLHLFHA